MDVLVIAIEIVKMIVDIGKWIAEKLTRRPKITPQHAPEIDVDTNTSLLSMLLKPMEPFFILFTKRPIILLTLFTVVGVVVKLNLDERIGLFFIGIIFAFSATGNLIVAHKDTDHAGCIHLLLYAVTASILLFGVLVAMGALLMMILGIPLRSSPR